MVRKYLYWEGFEIKEENVFKLEDLSRGQQSAG